MKHLYLFPNKPALHCIGPAANRTTSSGNVFAIATMHSRVARANAAGIPAAPPRSSLRPTSIAATFLHQSSQKFRIQSDNGTVDGINIHMDDAPHSRRNGQEAEPAFVIIVEKRLMRNKPGAGRPYLQPLIRDATYRWFVGLRFAIDWKALAARNNATGSKFNFRLSYNHRTSGTNNANVT